MVVLFKSVETEKFKFKLFKSSTVSLGVLGFWGIFFLIKIKMVLTGNQIPITERIRNFFYWFWGLIYLFFATIFNDPKDLARD